MDDSGTNSDKGLIKITGNLGGKTFKDFTVKEITLNESLLNPGLQTSVRFQSYIYSEDRRDYDSLKNKNISINLSSELGNRQMNIVQKIYRMDNREFAPINVGSTEEFSIHACDQTLLNDAKSLVSKSWKCATPDKIVKYVLQSCAGASNIKVDSAQPARDYIAENIHPFQVVAQQANVALDGDDPSFLHYMTFGTGMQSQPTHWFKSLKSLTKGSPKATFYQAETGVRGQVDYNEQRFLNTAITFEFPCDFDLLSDILNGIDESGQNINSLTVINPVNMLTQLLGGAGAALGGLGGGGASGGCGVGSGNPKQSVTDKGTNKTGCETDVEKHLLKRQARMGMLEKDKIALRITTAWRPDVHVGDLIELKWESKKDGSVVYGSGVYLVLHLMHRIQFGGYGISTFDCVAQTVGQGVV